MKVVRPTRLLAEAAEVLEPVRDDIVVIGAAALDVALAESSSMAITPTRDVDLVVPVDRVADVVSHLEAADLRPSDVPHERGFTWIRGNLKIQLLRQFHPFPASPAKALPANPAVGMATEPVHQLVIAFADDPGRPRLRGANAACLLALKQAAFGRRRPPDDRPVERDFHDAFLLISGTPDAVVADLGRAGYEVRRRADDAISQLAAGGDATAAAARQMVRLRTADSQRAAESEVRRAAARIRRQLAGTGV